MNKIAIYLKESNFKQTSANEELNKETKKNWKNEKSKIDKFLHNVKFKIKDTDVSNFTSKGVFYYVYEVTFDVEGNPPTVTKTLHNELSKAMGSEYKKYFPSVDGYGTVSIMYPTFDIINKNT